jgi:hypothetical protein
MFSWALYSLATGRDLDNDACTCIYARKVGRSLVCSRSSAVIFVEMVP